MTETAAVEMDVMHKLEQIRDVR